MTRKLLFIATAALAISSCTQVEVDEVAATGKEPIRFEQFISKATRAEKTAENLESYWVLGKVVKGEQEEDFKVLVSKKTGEWTYSQQIYWEAGAKYYFTATNRTNGTSMEVTSDEDYGIVLKYNAIDENIYDDVLTAVCPTPIVGKAFGNSPVSLSFKHAKSKVQFTFINGYDEDITDIQISNICLNGVETVAKYFSHNVSSGAAWSQYGGETGTLSFSYVRFSKPGDSETIYSVVYPQQLEEGVQLSFSVNYKKNDSTLWTSTIYVDIPTDEVSEWLLGHVYNYKITLKSKDPINFGVGSIDVWGEPEDQELEDVEAGAK